jgi:hypothetical protein
VSDIKLFFSSLLAQFQPVINSAFKNSEKICEMEIYWQNRIDWKIKKKARVQYSGFCITVNCSFSSSNQRRLRGTTFVEIFWKRYFFILTSKKYNPNNTLNYYQNAWPKGLNFAFWHFLFSIFLPSRSDVIQIKTQIETTSIYSTLSKDIRKTHNDSSKKFS